MDKHKIREFDSIADGHEQALIAMGVIDKKKRAARRGGPECPPLFISTFETYCDIKFTRHVREDAVVLFARESVTWQDLKAYLDVTQKQLSLFEIDIIMGLEAIFEGRNHV